jgi:acid phosphatase type 7
MVRWAVRAGIVLLLLGLVNFGAAAAPGVGPTIFLPLVASSLPVVTVPPTGDPTLVAAGDIASCGHPDDIQTAAIIAGLPQATVLTLGDNAYQDGTPAQFTQCYAPVWGAFLARTHPAIGNHEYQTASAAGYFGYFGAAAGDPTQGYYSFDLGAWHLISLNSECGHVGGCDALSPQYAWLAADLAAHPARCTLAYWHRPLFASGREGSDAAVQPLWQALYAAGVDVVLNGHDHIYERFVPQDPLGNSDPAHGITEFVVGTGGYDHAPMKAILPGDVVHDDTTFGVLQMALHPGGYDWSFLPIPGGSFTDSGSAACH